MKKSCPSWGSFFFAGHEDEMTIESSWRLIYLEIRGG